MKIIAGIHKGRVIDIAKNHNYRPSTSFLKEAIFSVITSGAFKDKNILKDSMVLDLFSGSGALSFEALSRGAKFSTMIESEKKHLDTAQNFAAKIGESERISSVHGILPQALRNVLGKYNLVFIDPPYGKNLVTATIKTLLEQNLLLPNSIIIVESGKNDISQFIETKTLGSIIMPINLLFSRVYSNSKLEIFEYDEKQT